MDLIRRKSCGIFCTKSVEAAFLFEINDGSIIVVISDPELLPTVNPVYFFPKGFVIRIIEIKASDMVLSVLRMRIGSSNGTKSLPYCKQIRIIDLVLPFVSVSLVYFVHPLTCIGFFEMIKIICVKNVIKK